MKDYKYVSKSLRSLRSEIQKTFDQLEDTKIIHSNRNSGGVLKNVWDKLIKKDNSPKYLYPNMKIASPENKKSAFRVFFENLFQKKSKNNLYFADSRFSKKKDENLYFKHNKRKQNKIDRVQNRVYSTVNHQKKKVDTNPVYDPYDMIRKKREESMTQRTEKNKSSVPDYFIKQREEIKKRDSVDRVSEIKGNNKTGKVLGFAMGLVSLIIISVGIFFYKSLQAQNQTYQPQVISYSYLGDVKLQQEFDNLETPSGTGGPDIMQEETLEPEFYFYRVQQGESIYSIAIKMGMTMDSLVSFNAMDNAHMVGVNERLLIPTVPGILYTVDDDDTLTEIAETYEITMDDIIEANEMDTNIVYAGDILFLPGAEFTATQRAEVYGYFFYKPVSGRISSYYGYRSDPFTGAYKWHAGLDIAAVTGTSVKAAKEGTVVYAGWNGGYGNCIKIKHQFGYTTVYAHLSSILVSEGEWVSSQETIGRVGSTGRSTGAHLHFEVQKYGTATNPTQYEGLKVAGGWF